MADVRGFLKYPRAGTAYRPVAERLHDWRVRAGGLPAGEDAGAGRALHGLRHPVLQQRLPARQRHPGLQRPRVPRQVGGRARPPALDQQLPRVHGPGLPRALRAGLRARHQRRTPVAIKQVEWEIVRRGWEEGWVRPVRPERRTGRSVAVVGSGPAGLAAAQQLNRAGHTVTLFEKNDRIGGLLRYGIPDFKLEKWVIDRRLEQLREEGVFFQTGVHVGVDLSAKDLRKGFDAVAALHRRRASRAISRCRAASSAACTSRWSSWRSRTAASPATRSTGRGRDPRDGQARDRARRRRHGLGLRRHLAPPGRRAPSPRSSCCRGPRRGATSSEPWPVAMRYTYSVSRSHAEGGDARVRPRSRRRLVGAGRPRDGAARGAGRVRPRRARPAADGNACARSRAPSSSSPPTSCCSRWASSARCARASLDGSRRRARPAGQRPGRHARASRPPSPASSPPATPAAASRSWCGRSGRAARRRAPSTPI